ncbi:MAG: 37S ribosomal protein S23 mitochondrial [Cirrosporium novae-zelandiae]|nr:MAG: 37S ribosomal protein S23 mitochondrial [Cirrosporium novae-zelandiae]
MTSPLCWGCLIRRSYQIRPISQVAILSTIQATASFSTTSLFYARVQSNSVSGPVRGVKALKISKSTPKPRGKRPDPGERKAQKKRIVLSNTNALEVPNVQDFTIQSLGDANVQGHMLSLPGKLVDQLRAVEAFKPTQGWAMFRKPSTLMRKETLDLSKIMDEISTTKGKNHRVIVTGQRGAGKSMLLLQGMATAFLKQWVVIHIPEAQDLTIGHTDYFPIPDITPTQYIQNNYTANLLLRIASANTSVLRSIPFENPSGTFSLPANPTLYDLAKLGAEDLELAWPVFGTLWKDLTSTTGPNSRPPIFLSLDGLHHIMKPKTGYIDHDAKPIHSHDLALVKHFVDYLSGAKTLPNGGVVIAATSASNVPGLPLFETTLRRREAQITSSPSSIVPEYDPFRQPDLKIEGSLNAVDKVVKLCGTGKDEARGLVEYIARSGLVRVRVNEANFARWWCVSGGGVVGELEKAVLNIKR